MKHIHIAALEPDSEFAKKIGKKGSESDFTIYNCKEGDRVICLYQPSKYPEKIQPLLYALSLCDAAYFRPNAIDKFAGEMLVACAVFGKPLIVVPDIVGRGDIEPLIRSAGVQQYEFFEGDANALREKLLSLPSMRKPDGKTEVIIDSCFAVKGIGTVALGIVQQGTVRVHQKLSFLPSGREAEIKSIQVQDVDVREAEASSRVGLSLRGLEADEVGKGDLAVEEKFPSASKIEASISLTKFYKGDITVPQFFVLSGLKYVACKAKRLPAGNFEIDLTAPMCLRQGETLCVFLPEAMPRAIGSAKVEKIIP
ncbi:MAG: EF-Tu/IF-2/RF-3 family GTPase [Candidatus Micrarchaeota archaeon]|nr:EF-Tu/IF-2/RF-3 family GTPase [Candidatus Micrarchaeota archaeon]